VIIAEERALRPSDLISGKPEAPGGGFCPFCPGNERKTPPEIWSVREGGSEPDGPGWQVRVIPNKFPALRVEGDLGRAARGIYDRMAGIGAHEVVVETPDHQMGTADLPREQLVQVLTAYRDRLKDLLQDPRLKYILIFKNHGARAGASLAHPHTQPIATTVTPRTIASELTACLEHHRIKERCLFCDILHQEISDGVRMVRDDGAYVTYAPYASRFPFEMTLLPRNHSHSFAELSDEQLDQLAVHLKDVLLRLKISLSDPAYNFVLHTSPNPNVIPRRSGHFETIEYDFHWHIEILPRVTHIAGFEWVTGFYINPTPPEIAAEYLRTAKPEEEAA
jgi:UDPglucose--hexose-1-phosphate uridylyltransferase